MRVANKHKGTVAGLEPGAIGEVDENNSGIAVFIAAGYLVDASLVATEEPEVTLDEAKRALRDASQEIHRLSDALGAARARVSELETTAPEAPETSPEVPAKKGKG